MARTLKIGDRGDDVGAMQQQLVEAGEQIYADELRNQFFGTSTKTAVLDFQSSHLGADNKPLASDGLVGPATQAALANPRSPVEVFIAAGWRGEPTEAPNAEAMAAVTSAINQLGNREDPKVPNGGDQVLRYGQQYDPQTKQYEPWCAYFASWCWEHTPAGSPFGIKASALKLKDWGAAHGRLFGADEPVLPGDIAILIRAKGRGHVGIVVSREFDGKISLMEGNCGNAVRATLRDRSFWSHFVRPRR